MEQVIAEKQIEKQPKALQSGLIKAKANMMTPGGAIILAAAIIISLVFVLSLFFPRGNGLQFVIITALTLVSWGFLLNCATERLTLAEGLLIYKSLIGRTVTIELKKIDSYKLTDLGLRFDGNMFLIEIEHEDKEEPEEILLSPCWNKADLTLFCDTLVMVLEEINQ
ncbi:hypothetical protein GF391_03540 [Candidatus Uhrbacteria bacterium]|nr:hypothetical protein [Candidatus Uhrbacteria bacterium]